MKTATTQSFRFFFLFVLSLFVAAPALAQQAGQVAGHRVKTATYQGRQVQYVARQVAVKRAPGATQAQVAQALQQQFGAAVAEDFDKLGWGTVELPQGRRVLAALSALEQSPLIEVAEPVLIERAHVGMPPPLASNAPANASDPNDSYYEGTGPAAYEHQWALDNTGQSPPGGTPGADINAPSAWELTTGDSGVLIAVLDSGIPMQQDGDGDWDEYDLSHPDLDRRSKIILGPDYAPGSGGPASGDGEGVRDRNGHGTHVAGIAAAETNNGTGIAGVCQRCKLMPIQVFNDNGSGTSTSLYNGIMHAVDYAESHNLELVINYSGGGPDHPQKEDAVEYASDHDVTLVASAGNANGGPVGYPAAYAPNYSNVVAVSSSDHNDDFSSFSSQGSEVVIAAPGGFGGSCFAGTFDANDIFSTTPNYSFTLDQCGVSQDYGYLPGTSMAAPQVAGTVGLMLSMGGRTASSVRDILESKARDLGSHGFDNRFGHGRLRAAGAVLGAIPDVFTTITSAPYTLDEGEEGTWKASARGGTGSPYSFTWQYRESGSSPWYGMGGCGNTGQSSSCTYAFTGLDQNMYGDVRVIAYNPRLPTYKNGQDQIAVRVNEDGGGGGGDPPPEPCNAVLATSDSLGTNRLPRPCSQAISQQQTGETSIRGAGAMAKAPEAFALKGSAPNPVRAGQRAEVRFALPEAAQVQLALYDVLGRRVAHLADGQMEAGHYRAPVNTQGLASGVYVYRLRARSTEGESFTGSGKMVIAK